MGEKRFSSERVHSGHLRVNACGKQWLSDRDYDSVREKGRVDFSVFYLAKGKGYYETGGIVSVVPEGSLLLYFPGVRQHYSFHKEDGAVQLWAHFSGQACSLLTELFSGDPSVIAVENRQQFESVFEQMVFSYYKKAPYADMTCEGYMTVLLSFLARGGAARPESFSRISDENLEKVLSRMHEHYNEPIDVSAYAAECFVSEDHFIRVFRKYTGQPPYHYQLQIRIERALEMLQTTSVSVRECGEIVGFGDVSYFCRIFKTFTGHPPSYFKK